MLIRDQGQGLDVQARVLTLDRAGVELTRALSRSADEKEWSDPSKRDVCWDNAARKGWAAVERE